MTKKVTIISIDYDGCFSILTPEGVEITINGNNKEQWEQSGLNIVERIKETQQQFNVFLSTITKAATAVKVYVGSDRQSYVTDTKNLNRNHNGSVFPALEHLCKVRSTKSQPWTFEPLLMADPALEGKGPFFRKRGAAYELIQKSHSNQLVITDPPVIFINPEGRPVQSKIPMLLNQMWDAYRQNPKDTQLEFNFIDDRVDIINDILQNLNPDEMPPKMSLAVSKFDALGVVIDESNALSLCGKIVSNKENVSPLNKLRTLFRHSPKTDFTKLKEYEGEEKQSMQNS